MMRKREQGATVERIYIAHKNDEDFHHAYVKLNNFVDNGTNIYSDYGIVICSYIFGKQLYPKMRTRIAEEMLSPFIPGTSLVLRCQETE